MQTNRRIPASDDQVFLIMGVNEADEDAQCAVVMARTLELAKLAFQKNFRGSVPMTWPSLREIKMSVGIMESAREGGLPDDLTVIDEMT